MTRHKLHLYVHIGQGKTGTSAIQAFLNYNRESLVEKYKILYPNFDSQYFGKGEYHNHAKVFTDKRELNIERKNKILDDFLKIKQYCEVNKIEKLVISWEGFFSKGRTEELTEVIKLLNCDFNFVLYLKRQDYLYESQWKQGGHKSSVLKTIYDFIETKNLDFNVFIEPWTKSFKTTDFIIRPFEKSIIGDDVVADFLKIIGVNDKSALITPPKTNLNVNSGFIPEVVEMLNLRENISGETKSNKMLAFVYDALPDEFKKNDPFKSYGILSSSDRLTIIKKYEESNNRFAKKFFEGKQDRLFNEPWPDENDKLTPNNKLTVEKIVPVLMEISYSQYKRIKGLEKRIKELQKFAGKWEEYWTNKPKSYSYLNLNLKGLKAKLETNQIKLKRSSKNYLDLISLGNDPYLIVKDYDYPRFFESFSIMITSPSITEFKLYYKISEDDEYSELNSMTQVLNIGQNSFNLELPKPALAIDFRIDPGTTPGRYVIYKVELGF